MAKAVSSLFIALSASVAGLTAPLKVGEKAVGSLVSKVGEAGSKLMEFTGIAALAGGAIGAVFEVGKSFQLAAQLETAGVQFRALTGSADKAQTVLDGLKEFAAHSPFQFPELADASKKLIAVGVNSEAVPGLLKQIGDVASGVGAPIGEIAEIFTRVAEEGHLSSREILQLGKQGIPITQALAASLHTTAAGVEEMVSNGQVGFPQLLGGFDELTGKGGKFGGIVDALNNTLGGRWKTLVDSVEMGGAKIAEAISQAFNLPGLVGNATGIFDRISDSIAGFITRAAPYITRFATGAMAAFTRIYAFVSPILNTITSTLTGAWAGMVAVVTSYGGQIISAVTGAWDAIVTFVTPIVQSLYNVIANNWQAIATTAITYGLSVYQLVSSVFSSCLDIAYDIWGGITGVVAWAWGTISGDSKAGADNTTTSFQGIANIAQWLGMVVSRTFSAISFGLNNFGTVVQLIGTGIAFDIVRLGNQFAWVCTGVIWPAVKWLWDNLVVFFSGVGKWFANLGGNIGSFFSNLGGIIKGNVKFGDIWKPLTEGITMEAAKWPGIVSRQVGPLEQALSDEQDSLSKKIGDGLGKLWGDNEVKAAGVVKTFTDAFKGMTAKPLVPEIKKPEIPTPDPVKVKAHLDPGVMQATVQVKVERAKTILSGSAESLALRYAPFVQGSFKTPAARADAQAQTNASYFGQAIPSMSRPGPAVPTAPATPTPATPNIPGATAAAETVAKQADKQQLDQMKLVNQWLLRIEQNTRPTNQNFVTI